VDFGGQAPTRPFRLFGTERDSAPPLPENGAAYSGCTTNSTRRFFCR